MDRRERFVAGLHGLRIRSPWPAGNRRATGSSRSDIDVAEIAAPLDGRWGDTGPGRPATPAWFRYARRPDGAEYVRWEGVAECMVAADGRRIEYRCLAPCSPEALETYLLGQILSFALVKRGIEPLHASAVMVDGGALAFLGGAGRGKSTLAAAFVRAGSRLVTDDLLAVGGAGGRVVAYPGPGRINLVPRTARHLLGGGVAGARMNGRTRKIVIPLPAECVVPGTRPVPLRAIYLLARPARARRARHVGIRPLSPRAAFVRLVANTFNPVVDEPARLDRLLDRASWLALRVPVRAVTFPRALAALPAVLRAILADAAR